MTIVISDENSKTRQAWRPNKTDFPSLTPLAEKEFGLYAMQSTYKPNPNSQTITISSVKQMIFQGSDHCREAAAASPPLPDRKLEQTREKTLVLTADREYKSYCG